MKKKIWIVAIAVLCLAIAGALVACNKKVTIELNKTEVSVEVGDKTNLVATTSDGSEVTWASSDESIATVSSRGVVTGVKAGTAKVTATSGKAVAECTVTVKEKVVITFKDAAGTALTEAEVDREGTLQLNATASDGSTVTTWASSDQSSATVSSSGLVSGIFDGETNISVKTSSGATGSIKVTVVDNFDGVKYTITNAKEEGKWWYFTATDGGKNTSVDRAEFRGDVITFNYSGNGNWYWTDIQLGLRKTDKDTDGWKHLTAKIEADFDGDIIIHDTEVHITKGEVNNISVCFDQGKTDEKCLIYFSGVSEGKVKITDLNVTEHTVTELSAPAVAYSEGNVTINDTVNADGVKKYVVGLFEGEAMRYAQTFDSAEGGKLNIEDCEFGGEFVVKVRAMGQPGYTSSDWSTDETVKVTVEAKSVSYELTAGTDDGKTAEQAAVIDGKWHAWNEWNNLTEQKYKNGTVTLNATDWGGNWYSMQLFKHYSYFDANANIKISLTINAPVACHITVTGKVLEVKAGTHTYDVYTKQPNGGATVGIQFGVQASGIDIPTETEYKFTVSGIAVSEYEPEQLTAPTSIAIDGEKIVTVTDTNAEGTVGSYEAGFFTEASGEKPSRTVIVKNGEALDTSKIPTGTYTVKVRAVAKDGSKYVTSDWSATGVENYEVETIANEEYNVPFGGSNENPNASTDQGVWYMWNDQNWCGSNVTVSEAKYDHGTITFKFTSTGAFDAGLQIFYVNPDYVEGNIYSLDIATTADMKITVAGQVLNVVGGAEATHVTGAASSAITIVVNVADNLGGTITISNVVWAAPQE